MIEKLIVHVVASFLAILILLSTMILSLHAASVRSQPLELPYLYVSSVTFPGQEYGTSAWGANKDSGDFGTDFRAYVNIQQHGEGTAQYTVVSVYLGDAVHVNIVSPTVDNRDASCQPDTVGIFPAPASGVACNVHLENGWDVGYVDFHVTGIDENNVEKTWARTVQIIRATANNLWEIDGEPASFQGAPGDYIDVTFSVNPRTDNYRDFSQTGYDVTDSKAWLLGHDTLHGKIPKDMRGIVFANVRIDVNAKPKDVDLVTLTVPDPISIDKTVLVIGPGDYNGDGAVDGQDFFILLLAWGTHPPSDPRADGNHDGYVDGSDFFILLQNWGNAYP